MNRSLIPYFTLLSAIIALSLAVSDTFCEAFVDNEFNIDSWSESDDSKFVFANIGGNHWQIAVSDSANLESRTAKLGKTSVERKDYGNPRKVERQLRSKERPGDVRFNVQLANNERLIIEVKKKVLTYCFVLADEVCLDNWTTIVCNSYSLSLKCSSTRELIDCSYYSTPYLRIGLIVIIVVVVVAVIAIALLLPFFLKSKSKSKNAQKPNRKA